MAATGRTEDTPVAEEVARSVAHLVGDGCIVAVPAGTSAGFRILATAHREVEGRARLERLSDHDCPWALDAVAKHASFRLEGTAAGDCAFGDGAVSAAVVAPLHALGGVAIAVRDSCDFAYTADEQRRVEQIASEGAPQLMLTPQRYLELAPAAVWVTDEDGITTYVNQAACRLAGVAATLLVGEPLARFLPDGARTRRPERVDRLFVRPDGAELWVSVAAEPLTDGAGRRRGSVLTLVDADGRRRVEAAARVRFAGLEAASQIAEAAFAGEAFEVLAGEAVAVVADILGAEYASLAEVAPGGRHYVTRAVHGWPARYVGSRRLMPELSPGRMCLDEDAPFVVHDLAQHRQLRLSAAASIAQPRSVVCVRVGAGRGFLSAHSPRPHAFKGQDLAFMRLLASALAARWEAAPARDRPLAAVAG